MKPSKESITPNERADPAKAPSPLVSIIIPAYKVTRFIAETLDSALAQTYHNFEIIFVNDGCPDTENLERVLVPYRNRITYIVQSNGGAAAARNTALMAAKGDYLAFLDGDDIWKPEYLSMQLRQLATQNCEAIYCNAELFGGNIAHGRTYMELNPAFGEVSPVSLIKMVCNPITSGMVVKRNVVLSVGLFDTSLPNIGFEDFDLWFRIAKGGHRIGYHRNVLLRYRVRNTSLSGGLVKQAERTVVVWETIRSKYELTPAEAEALVESLQVANNRLAIERFRESILFGDHEKAQKQLAEVAEFSTRLKLRFVALIARASPKLFNSAYKMLRPSEFEFVATGRTRAA